MLMKLDPAWLIFAVVTVSMFAYMFSLGLDAILNEDGFGPFGNAGIITAGFFGTIYLANGQGIRFSSLLEAALTGLGGAFAAMLVLTFLKALLGRAV